MPPPTTIRELRADAYRVPAQARECDGTLCWDATELVVVHVSTDAACGIGYSYTQALPAAALLRDKLGPCLLGEDALALPQLWRRMNEALRNLGRPGLGMMALAAADIALWDLKAKLLGVPLAQQLGSARDAVPLYGSGGFTSYDDADLQAQLGNWARSGFRAVKMKVGSHPEDDARRVRIAREAVGGGVELMVDANGAYDRVEALALAQDFAASRVCWLEEPVSSDDLDGLRWLSERVPAGMAVAAGEYAWDAGYFRAMLEARAVGVLQADATRCGYTGFLQAAALCEAFHCPLSAHCAPAIHVPLCAAVTPLRHLEYFHDHARLEPRLFDGVPEPDDGVLRPNTSVPGHGLSLKTEEAARYALSTR
ncbi:MAG: enolase C-terminal domain-like protein [Pseudomonadota bacterium]